jgi:maltooligosyltrehalose synthase
MAQPAKRVMNPPRATMRLQFHKGFTFDDAVRQVSYWPRLVSVISMRRQS